MSEKMESASDTREGPTLSELSQDINNLLERMREMQNAGEENGDYAPGGNMTTSLQSFEQLSELCRENPEMVQPPGLADYVRESISMLEESDACGPPGSDGEAEFIGRVASSITFDKYLPGDGGGGDRIIKEGNVAMIHSLASQKGKKLNGSRVLVLKYHPDQERWECRVEYERGGPDATKALREANLTHLRRAPLPAGPDRGNAAMRGDNLDAVPPKLCELLLNHQREGFEPSDIVFRGYAAHMFSRMGEDNFGFFVATQIEQIGAVLGLGNFCEQAGEQGTEAVVFALLEGDEMYVDTFLQTMYWTGEIIKSDWDDGYSGREGFRNDCPPTKLTPDQDTEPYVRTMKEGPVLVLQCVAEYCFASALWAAMSRSEYYHLLVQRLLRWTAREAKKTDDGLALGAAVRKVLSNMFPEVASTLNRPISEKAADGIMRHSAAAFSDPSLVTAENLVGLLGQPQDIDVHSLD